MSPLFMREVNIYKQEYNLTPSAHSTFPCDLLI